MVIETSRVWSASTRRVAPQPSRNSPASSAWRSTPWLPKSRSLRISSAGLPRIACRAPAPARSSTPSDAWTTRKSGPRQIKPRPREVKTLLRPSSTAMASGWPQGGEGFWLLADIGSPRIHPLPCIHLEDPPRGTRMPRALALVVQASSLQTQPRRPHHNNLDVRGAAPRARSKRIKDE